MQVQIDSYHTGLRTVEISENTRLGDFLRVFAGNPGAISVKVVRGGTVLVGATPGDLLLDSSEVLRNGDEIFFYPKKIEGARSA